METMSSNVDNKWLIAKRWRKQHNAEDNKGRGRNNYRNGRSKRGNEHKCSKIGRIDDISPEIVK